MLSIENWSQNPNDVITIEDIYWADNGPDGEWDWIDMQDGDTFQEGHNYYCMITFGLSNSDFYMYASEDDFTVNANGVSIPSLYSKGEDDTIYYDPSTGAHKGFTVNMYCKAGEDNTVYNAGITTQNITDGMTVSQANPKANLSGVYIWLQLGDDDDAVRLEDTDRFKAGKTYRLMADLNTPEGKVFAPNTTATVNSNSAVVDMISADTLCVHYDFTIPGEATGVTVSGTATSFGSATDNVTVQLIASGESTAAYETVVKGNSASYTIEGVVAGTYTMKVMKNNHVTREYTVVVGNSSVIQDVEIWLLGDVNGDGTINAKDKKIIYGHINDSTTELTGYIFDVGDVNKDGVINAKDKKLIFGHINGTSLWS